MKELTLVILAAGMGSRYGGLKQIDPVDEEGNKIIDFSIYDAIRAGFKKVVFIIKKENEADFRSCIGDLVSPHIKVEYVFQDLTDLPEGFSVPEGREKPWGTTHAILACRDVIDGPFAVINADDFYGEQAYKVLADYLNGDIAEGEYAMVGYKLANTLTDNGYVSRGVCSYDDNGFLSEIHERTHIEKREHGAAYTENGTDYMPLTGEELVSMNFWGFTPGIIKELGGIFERFLKDEVPSNPLKSECYIPVSVDELLKAKKATVKVLSSPDRWFGVTYKEDKPMVVESVKKLKAEGRYPEKLWD